MEMKIRKRSKIIHLITLFCFLVLVWAYAQIEWGMPNTIQSTVSHSRGSILASDGSVLARTVEGKRVYPQHALAGQLIGMMGKDKGLEGLESVYEHSLSRGEHLKITIDPQTQANAETALAERVKQHKAEYGAVLIMETRTGRLLAAANYPPFDPNNWRDHDAKTRRNRPFLDSFEPGSVIKGLTVAAALNEKITTPSTKYYTPMKMYVGGRWGSTIGDVVNHPNQLTTKQILRYSSNVGMAQIVKKFPSDNMRRYFESYGFGKHTSLPNMSQAKGILQPLKNWGDLVRTTNAFGQGLSVSMLQLAAAYNAIANDGVYVPPRLVEGVSSGERHKVVDAEVARQTRSMLEAVVSEGIPHAASIKGYSLAGKTGTAQVVVNGKYSDTIYKSTFAGFFPADAPRVTIVVMAHGAKIRHHGSQLAAPIYRKIAAGLLSDWGAAPKIESLKTQPPTQATPTQTTTKPTH